MAIIVEHLNTGKRAVLLGAGYGAYKASRPSAIFGSWAPVEDAADISMLAVTDESGAVLWCKSDEIKIVSVDGVAPSELL